MKPTEIRRGTQSLVTTAGKQEFIRDLTTRIAIELCAIAPRMPALWDGHELRELIADYFERERTERMRSDRTRRREYQAALLDLGI